MEIRLNGEKQTCEDGVSLEALLQLQPVPDRGVLVAVNEKLVRRERWEDYRLNAGDRVEIISAFEGG